MFSKPIVIASSIAAANAALMGQTSTAFATVTQAAGLYSDDIGCGACLSYTDTTFITASADSLWETIASAAKAALNATTATNIDGWICCKDKATKETTSTGTTLCAVGKPDSSNTNKGLIDAATEKSFYWPTVLAQCPHQKDTCVVAGLKADGKTALTFTDERYLELTELKSSVTLSMKQLATADLGTAPSLKQRKGDVCTWVVAGQCHAPVITVPKASGTMTASPDNEWAIQVTEWGAEFADADDDKTWKTNAGATSKLYYPEKKDMSTIITDLLTENVAKTTPNNILGEVKFKTPAKDGKTYLSVPGNTLQDWITNVKAVYDSYDAEVKKYDEENKAWKTYAEYSAPAPGLFDWLFGPTADPDKPKTVSSPLQPTQPVDVPDTIKNLAIGATTAPASPAEYTATAGWGYPVAYSLVPVAEKTVRPWGVLAGGGQKSDTATAVTDADSGYSVRKTSNKSQTDATKCNKSYVMITAMMNKAPGTAKTI